MTFDLANLRDAGDLASYVTVAALGGMGWLWRKARADVLARIETTRSDLTRQLTDAATAAKKAAELSEKIRDLLQQQNGRLGKLEVRFDEHEKRDDERDRQRQHEDDRLASNIHELRADVHGALTKVAAAAASR